jgi:hypothetical protein
MEIYAQRMQALYKSDISFQFKTYLKNISLKTVGI